tara:strand:+ start:15976 stop:17106 length:1131 start_codon:yes stop_codon:yes gene_type:complete
MFKRTLLAASVAALGLVGPALADDVLIVDVAELSGAGAAAGGVWHDGVVMGFDDVNAAGGILGRMVDLQGYDSQTDPMNSRGMVQRAIDDGTYVLMGTVYSSSTIVNMLVAQQNGMPQFTGSEAPSITAQGNPYIFRTAFGAQMGLPKIGAYLANDMDISRIAIVWANTEFGRGGYDAFMSVAADEGMEVVADIPTEQAQVDFAADVTRVISSGAEAVFVYLTEEESARFLIAARQQGLSIPMAGDTVLVSQRVIDLAGDAANGAMGHVGLSASAPVPAIQEFSTRFQERFGYTPDHNAIKGYIGAWTVRYVTELIGDFDREAFAQRMHGLCLDAATYPGVLMDVCWDDTGEISRESFLVEVVDGQQVITRTLAAN